MAGERAAVIPALVVSGFLGSGKTTLVRALLADAQKRGIRVAVISNEFGELGIDQALLGSAGGDFVEIEGGCVCCRLSDELVKTLQQLYERVRPDRVIVETSGVALPFDVQLHFWREPVSRWAEDCIAAVVVNAEQLAEGRDLDDTFEQQVSSADLLLLNQVDRVAERELPRLMQRLRAIEPDAPVVLTVHGDADPSVLFVPPPGARRPPAGGSPAAHRHERFHSEVLRIEAGVSPAALVARIAELGALRAKGFVRTSEGLRIVQGVGRRIELAHAEGAPPPELVGRVVAIRRADAGSSGAGP